MKATGIILLIVGALLTIFTTFTTMREEKVLDIGKLEVTKDKPHTVAWSPFVGVALMAVGGVVLFMGAKK